MDLDEALTKLESLSDEKLRARNERLGWSGEQFGAQMGGIRTLAKRIKSDHALGLDLWKSGNLDARLLACRVLVPKQLSPKELDTMVRDVTFMQLAEWFTSYVVKQHPSREELREKWMQAKDPGRMRAGWSLTSERIARDPDGLDAPALLARIDAELARAHAAPQWTMNGCLAQIGIHFPALRKRALEIGERHGVYRDYPVSKGCTSPFAPIWIGEMVKRSKSRG